MRRTVDLVGRLNFPTKISTSTGNWILYRCCVHLNIPHQYAERSSLRGMMEYRCRCMASTRSAALTRRSHRLAKQNMSPTQPVSLSFPLAGKHNINIPCDFPAGACRRPGRVHVGFSLNGLSSNVRLSSSLDIYSSQTSGRDVRDTCTRLRRARPRRKTHRIAVN